MRTILQHGTYWYLGFRIVNDTALSTQRESEPFERKKSPRKSWVPGGRRTPSLFRERLEGGRYRGFAGGRHAASIHAPRAARLLPCNAQASMPFPLQGVSFRHASDDTPTGGSFIYLRFTEVTLKMQCRFSADA